MRGSSWRETPAWGPESWRLLPSPCTQSFLRVLAHQPPSLLWPPGGPGTSSRKSPGLARWGRGVCQARLVGHLGPGKPGLGHRHIPAPLAGGEGVPRSRGAWPAAPRESPALPARRGGSGCWAPSSSQEAHAPPWHSRTTTASALRALPSRPATPMSLLPATRLPHPGEDGRLGPPGCSRKWREAGEEAEAGWEASEMLWDLESHRLWGGVSPPALQWGRGHEITLLAGELAPGAGSTPRGVARGTPGRADLAHTRLARGLRRESLPRGTASPGRSSTRGTSAP